MIDNKKAIIQLDKETIILDELSFSDEANAGDPATVKLTGNRVEIDTGFAIPLIKINAYIVRNLLSFKLDLSQKIPQLIFRFIVEDEIFLYTSYPKDGDLVSLYIRSTSELYKPIRMDLLVTEVYNNFPIRNSSADYPDNNRANGDSATFTIKAQMRIPGLLKHTSKAFNNQTAFQVLRNIAKELNLGFASNENGSNDTMNWICPNKTYYRFIDDVCNSAWKGEEDFFDWWIDQYYVLNFVNLKKQLLEKSNNDNDALIAIGTENNINGGIDGTNKPAEIDLPQFFTNDFYYIKYPFFITAYSVKNNAGHIVNNFGYSRNLEFYDSKLVSDQPINKFVNYQTEYVTEKNLGPNSIIFKGRVNEDVYKKEVKKTWIGTQYGENQHENLSQAIIQNRINKYENFKVYIETQMHSFIPWVYRGQTIPVRIVHANALQARVASQEAKDAPPIDSKSYSIGKKVDNKFLSGFYMIMGSYIEYIDGKIQQSFILGKREWTINDGRGSDPGPDVKN